MKASLNVLLLIALLLTACEERTTSTPAAIPSGQSDIQIAVTSNDFEAGEPRVPFVLFSGTRKVADAQRVKLIAFDLTPATPTPSWSGEAISYSDYEVPYWVAFPDLPHPGFWGVGAEITLADGSTTAAQFSIEVVEDSSSPAIGARPPASENRTLETEPDIHKLTSGSDPQPALYQMTVAEALESGRPSVVAFATPAFCTSKLCAPVVRSVEAVFENLGDQANFIHIEVYKTFDPLIYADEINEWGLLSEPWTFVLDKEGKVARKFGGPVSPRELSEALEPLLQ